MSISSRKGQSHSGAAAHTEKPIDPEQWVHEYGDYLFGFACSRVRTKEDAEDLVQDCFVTAIKSFASFEQTSALRTWLVGILRHKIFDYYRKSNRDGELKQLLFDDDIDKRFSWNGHWRKEPGKWTVDPQIELANHEFQKTLGGCLDKVPKSLARIFVLREVEELESADICELLGISSANLYTALHRVRFRLRECLEIEWFDKKENP